MASNYDSAMSGEVEVSPKDKAGKLSQVRSRVQDAQRERRKGRWDERWNKYIQVYCNQYPYPELTEYDDVVVPNMVFSTVNVIVPAVAINSPKINVTANQAEDEAAAPVVEAVVNHQWRAYDVQDQVREAVKDFVMIGLGWLKVVWETEEREVPLSQEEFTELAAQALAERSAGIAAAPGMEDDFPSIDEVLDNLPVKQLKVVKDQPLVRRVSPFDIFVDPDATTLTDARWICQRAFVPIEVARRNEEWSLKARNRLKKVKKARSDAEHDLLPDALESGEAGFAEVYEFYDLVSGKMCVFADGCDEFLVDFEDAPFPGGHPFVWVPNYEVPERFFPIGDVETIYPLQVELALTRTAQLNDRKRGRRITLFRESALDSEGVESLRAGADNVMINVTNTSSNFDEVFRQVSSQGLQPEWYRADEQAMADINTVSGVAEFLRGGDSEIRRTATEIGVMQDAANARFSDKLAKVEKAMGAVAERMILLSQQFMDSEAVARVVDDTQAVNWVPYDRDALQGEFTFVVEAGSSQPQNESFKRQQALQMMDILGQFMGSGLLNDQEVLAQVMRLNGWHDTERFLGPGLQPPVDEGGVPGGPEVPMPGAGPDEGSPPMM